MLQLGGQALDSFAGLGLKVSVFNLICCISKSLWIRCWNRDAVLMCQCFNWHPQMYAVQHRLMYACIHTLTQPQATSLTLFPYPLSVLASTQYTSMAGFNFAYIALQETNKIQQEYFCLDQIINKLRRLIISTYLKGWH